MVLEGRVARIRCVPATTWLFVTIRPSDSSTNPVAAPPAGNVLLVDPVADCSVAIWTIEARAIWTSSGTLSLLEAGCVSDTFAVVFCITDDSVWAMS